jgi:hypothetical protein
LQQRLNEKENTMSAKYFAKVVNMQQVTVAMATTEQEAETLRQQQYEPCSRAFYESVLRSQTSIAATTNTQ